MNYDFSFRRAIKVLIAIVLISSSAAVHADAYIHFAGITGGSSAANYKGWSEINSYNWGISNTSTTAIGGGGGSGKTSVSNFSWGQAVDSAFVPLFVDVATGRHIANAEVDFTKSSGKSDLAYFKMNFTDVLVNSLAIGGVENNNGLLPETAAINFGVIKITYQGTNPDGSMAKAVSATWDVAKNKIDADFGAVYAQALVAGFVPSAVPEPEPAGMLLVGLAMLGLVAWRRRV